MALRSGTQGSLLQGVSQQPARVRLTGQVTEQKNMISDVTLGLSTRPATTEGAVINADRDMAFQDITFEGTDYVLGYAGSGVTLWDLDGVEFPVAARGGADLSYVGQDMQLHVVDENIVLLNREVEVAKDTTVNGLGWQTGLYHSLGGQFLRTYKIEINFSTGEEVTVTYTTPDGTDIGDASATTSEAIIEVIDDLLNTVPLGSGTPPVPADTAQTVTGYAPVGTVFSRHFDVGLITHPTSTISITVSDGDGGEILRAATGTVKDVTDLPRFAPNGTVVEVVTSDAEEDDYWLRFFAKDIDTEDGVAGFGIEGVWKEWYDPDAERLFDLSTMPHVIVKDSGSFYLEQGPWLGRAVGDTVTSPYATIIGKRLRDMVGFESRLALLSTDTVVMSRTNEPFDLWRESATVKSSTDPIDITSTKKNDLVLDWFTTFDRDLFIMADPGDSQFVIRGGGVTPDNASMVLTTEFEISSGGTPPVSTGRTILFPFSTGQYSGIKEFYTDSENAANAANSLTETQDRYINGDVVGMAVSQNFNLGLFRTTEDRETVWVYKYLWDGNEVLQSAWGKWVFQDTVEHFFFRGSLVHIVGRDYKDDAFLHTMDLNRPLGEYGYHEMLDRKQSVVVTLELDFIDRPTGRSYVILPFKTAKFLQGAGCHTEGIGCAVLETIDLGDGTYQFLVDSDQAPDGATLICGQRVPWELEPTQVFAVDYQGNIDTNKKVTVQDYVVHVDNSGSFTATGSSPYSDDWSYEAYAFPLDGEPLDPDRLSLQFGAIFVPWGERADYSTLTLSGDDIRPVTILELSWTGQILSTKGRRA